MRKLDKMLKALEKAEAEFLVELKREYPVGTAVVYRLRGGKDAHRYPFQTGTVVGYANDGRRLRVELAQSRHDRQIGREGNNYITSLPITKIQHG